MKITDDRARDLLRWLDDMAGDHTLLFDEMARYRDAAALIRQLQAAEQVETAMVHASWKIKNLRRRVNRARKFPVNTCSSSRHLHLMADTLASGKPYMMLIEEPEHCAMSIYAVLESLWKARTELARLKGEPPNTALTGRAQGASE